MPNSIFEPTGAIPVQEAIREHALQLGFDAVGFAAAESPDAVRAGLAGFLNDGRHGDMEWMARTAGRRADPRALWPNVRTVVAVAANYGPEVNPLDATRRRREGAVSVYARNADYHDVLKRRLKELGGWIVAHWGGDVKVFVDTAPVMEKPLAQAAGLGWQGKHTNLVSQDFGSWLFLGSVFTTLALPVDRPGQDLCGSCSRCIDVCPTGAITAPYRLDARRCISYLTIEHKGHIDRALRESLGNRIYGCDDCLAVCPWNKFARIARDGAFHPRPELTAPLLAELAQLDDGAFRQLFRGSPIKRTGRNRLVRNVLIAIGNSGEASLAPVAEARLRDESPLVRAMAVWALSRLVDRNAFQELAERHMPVETDPDVLAEWRVT